MMSLVKILIVCLFSLIVTISAGQNNNILNNRSYGINTGFPFISEQLPEDVYYNPVLLMGFYNIPLKQVSGTHNFSVGIEPQFNPVFLDNSLTDIEFGCNVGIYYLRLLNNNSQLYAAIGSGPHFVTVDTRMQAKGFIFSDNFMAGIKKNISKNNMKPMYVNIQLRFRHISNANFMKPNIGIDGFFAVIGFIKDI